mmetsp:Transcript_36684/g.42870  ORF Transcript_36684/g.42870 Transcript_36684/m.42870 type:complete len:437 (-) Transcript_36684:294-1604(-)
MSATFRSTLSSSGGGAYFAHDPAPQVRPAGKIWAPEEGGVRADITQNTLNNNRIATPEGLKPFRKDYAMALASPTRHYGFRTDSPRDTMRAYGMKLVRDGSVEASLNPNSNADKMNSLSAEHAEQRYLSHRKEPLGRVPDPSIPIPDRLLRDGFGKLTEPSESAKSVIYSSTNKDAKQLNPAGEQKTRNYNWASTGVDPTVHRFGLANEVAPITTKQLMNPQQAAHVLPKIVKDFNSVSQPQLGKTRSLGFGNRTVGADHTYGKTQPRDVLNAKQLITGAAIQEIDRPDLHGDDSEYNQLGGTFVKSITQRKIRSEDRKAMNESQSFGGTGRSLGVPSVRTDIPKPDEGSRKITNGVNYGDDVAAKHLLYPNQYISNGIMGKYFAGGRTLDELKALATKLEFGLTDTQMETAFLRVQVEGKASVEDFKNALTDLGY